MPGFTFVQNVTIPQVDFDLILLKLTLSRATADVWKYHQLRGSPLIRCTICQIKTANFVAGVNFSNFRNIIIRNQPRRIHSLRNDVMNFLMILRSKEVLIKPLPFIKIRGIKVEKQTAAEFRRIIFQEANNILVIYGNSAPLFSNGSYLLDEWCFVKPNIQFPLSGLGVAADRSGVQNSWSIGSVKEQSSEGQFERIILCRKIYFFLTMPFRDWNRSFFDEINQSLRLMFDSSPKRINGLVVIVDINAA